jgi:hypothetical protein
MFSGLSPELECRMDQLLAAVVERLEQWGHIAKRLEPLTSA